MADTSGYYPHRAIYTMEEYQESDFTDPVILCIPKFAWLVARQLLSVYGLRQNAYSVGYNQLNYDLPSDALFGQIMDSIGEALSGGDMSCDLEVALEAMTNAISSLCGCFGTSGGGGSFGAPDVDPPPEEFEDTGSNFPDGFDDRADYDLYKCQVANALIQGIYESANWLATASLASLTLTTLAATFLTPIPFDELAVLLGMCLALIAQAALGSTCVEITDFIDDFEEELICILFGATDATVALTGIRAYAESELSATAYALFAAMTWFAGMNALFKEDAVMGNADLSRGVDCDAVCCQDYGTAYTVIDRQPTYTIVESLPGDDDDFLYISQGTEDINAITGAGGPFGPYCASSVSTTVTIESGSPTAYSTRDDAGDLVTAEDTPFPGGGITTSDRHILVYKTGHGVFQLRFTIV